VEEHLRRDRSEESGKGISSPARLINQHGSANIVDLMISNAKSDSNSTGTAVFSQLGNTTRQIGEGANVSIVLNNFKGGSSQNTVGGIGTPAN